MLLTTQDDFPVDRLEIDIQAVRNVDRVCNLAVWELSPGSYVGSLQVQVAHESLVKSVVPEVRKLLRSYGVARVTIEPLLPAAAK